MKARPPFKISHSWRRGTFGTVHKYRVLELHGRYYQSTRTLTHYTKTAEQIWIRCILLLAALLFSVPYAEADSIVSVQGSPVAGGLAITSTQSLSQTWTQSNVYSNEAVSAWLFSGYQNGQPATSTVTAWLTGNGITLSDTFDLSSPFASLVPLFDVAMLAPGSYSLTLTSQNSAGWVWGPETGQPVNVMLANGTTITTIAGSPLFFEVWGQAVATDPPPVVTTPEPPAAAEVLVTIFGLCLGYFFTRMVFSYAKSKHKT